MIKNGCAILNDLQFTFLSGGPADGEPVILLHGFPQFADVWSQLIEDFSENGFRAVAPDQRGYAAGARPVGIEKYKVQELGSDVMAFADSFGWSSFHLVGHDWGGFLGWKLAAEQPGRVLSLTVLSTPHVDAFLNAVSTDADQRVRSRYIEFFRMPGNVAEEAFLQEDATRLRGVYQGKVPIERVSENVQRLAEPGALTAALNWYRALDLNARIGAVNVPTLYIWGDNDSALGRAAAEATAAYIRGSYQFEILPGYSHWLQDEAHAKISPIIRDHMKAHMR